MRRTPAAVTLALALGMAGATTFAAPPASAITCAGTDWAADYYINDKSMTNAPDLSRCDPAIDFSWGAGGPGAPIWNDLFSARWTRTVDLAAGTYKFDLQADDGIRFLIDGVLVLDGWRDQGVTPYSVTKSLTAGNHTLVVEYYEGGGDATAKFSYAAVAAAPVNGNLIGNPSLADGAGFPDCFFDGSWGTMTHTGAFTNDVPTGRSGRSWVQTVSSYASGDAKIVPSEGPGCAASVDATKGYSLSFFVKGTATAVSVPVFTMSGTGGWNYWTTLATIAPTGNWAQQTLTVPPLPAGTTRLTFGVAQAGNGTLSTTGYSVALASSAPPVEPPAPAGLAATGRWSVANYQMTARAMHSTLLTNGKILLLAGSGNDYDNFQAGSFTGAVLDPKTGASTPLTVPSDMFCSGHVTLPNGKVLIQGGTKGYGGQDGNATYIGLKSSYVFDPANNSFTRVNDTQEGRWYPTLTKLGSGDVWMSGGLNGDGSNYSVTLKTELFKSSENRWVNENEVTQAWQWWGEYPHMILGQSGKLLYTGAHTFDAQKAGTGSMLYDIGTGQVSDIQGLPDKDSRDHAGSIMLPPAQSQTVMIAGGGWIDRGITPTNSVGLIKLNDPAPAYRTGAPLPGPGRQYLNLTNLFDRTTLASNGGTSNRGGNIFAAAIYNPATGAWSTDTPPDPVGRNYHSSTQLLPDGRVMVFGSNPLDNSYELRISIYEPPYLFKGTRPTITSAPATSTYGGKFNIGVTGDVQTASLTTLGSQTHQMDTNARLVDLPITGTGTTRAATVPANRNLLPPGPYMLTVLDSKGVPSVARVVSVR